MPGLRTPYAAPAMQTLQAQMPQAAPQQLFDMGFPSMSPPSYEVGGMVGPGGMPVRPDAMPAPGGMPQAGPGVQPPEVDPQMMQQQLQQFAQQNPEQLQMVQQAVMESVQTGEIDTQQLNMLVQMAQVALNNPAMYPQLRAAAIQQGIIAEQDIDPQFDPGLLMAVLIVGQSMGGADGQPALPSMERGGPLPHRANTSDGSIPINAHEGEYVIPADVVRTMGTRHFDTLIQKSRENGSAGTGR